MHSSGPKLCPSTTSMQQLRPAYSGTSQRQISDGLCVRNSAVTFITIQRYKRARWAVNTHKGERWFARLFITSTMAGFLGRRVTLPLRWSFFFCFVLLQLFVFYRFSALRQSACAHTHAHTQCNYVGLLHWGPQIDKKQEGLVHHFCFIVQTSDLDLEVKDKKNPTIVMLSSRS